MPSDTDALRFDVIVMRNKLSNGVLPDGFNRKIATLVEEVESRGVPLLRTWKLALNTARQRADAEDFVGAATQLTFVHNLPLAFDELESWDHRHFFKIELLGFIDLEEDDTICRAVTALGEDLGELRDRNAWQSDE